MDDIETILNTLIYDGKVEMTIIAAKEGTVGSVDGQVKLYRGVNAIIQPTGMVRTPCGLCPVSEWAAVWPGRGWGGGHCSASLELTSCFLSVRLSAGV